MHCCITPPPPPPPPTFPPHTHHSEKNILFVLNTSDVQSVQWMPFGMVTLTPVQVVNSSSGSVPPSVEQILSMRVETTVALNMTTGNDAHLETCGLIVVNRQQEIVAAVDFRLV